MATYWQDITKQHGQESHTSTDSKPPHAYHILDNSIISKLYKLERAAHVLYKTDDKRSVLINASKTKQQNQRGFVSHLAGNTLLFDKTFAMLMQGNNTLVIPESVLKECYANTRAGKPCPFHSDDEGGWQWDYASQTPINAEMAKLKNPWDDRGLLLSNIIHQAFETDQVAVYPSAEAFSEKEPAADNKKKLVIICDKEPNGDSAIRGIIHSMNSIQFPAVSVLTNDQKLSGKLHSLHEALIHVDISKLMDSYVKYSQSALFEGSKRFTRDSMNAVFAKAHQENIDFYEKEIRAIATATSNEFLECLGLGAAKTQGQTID